ncbi:MAG: penicillin-binding protein 2 [Clostridia bacterium]|nr:penicillin-binding protein 2 [Clostridia bacterium]
MDNQKNSNTNLRYNILIVAVYIVGFILLAQLFNLQILNGDEYRSESSARLTRETIVLADRGEILDRNGMKLVTTSTGYNLDLYKTTTDNAQLNNNILNIIRVLEENGDSYVDNLILQVNPFGFSTENEDTIKRWKKNNGIDENYDAQQCFNFFKDKYEIQNEDITEARKIMAIRYEISHNGYSNVRPIEIANNITKNSVLKFSEKNNSFSGIDIVTKPVVTYNNGTLASHVLGYCGKITQTELENVGEEYNKNEIIGKTGIQYVFESYLRGQNGIRQIDMDVNGNITGEYITEEPIVGSDVQLTIDAKVQSVAEQALKYDIEKIANGGYAETSDAKAGAVVVMNTKTGEILALASYPDYEPQLFVEGISTEKYNEYRENEALYNRAISGTYAPGSTFKMVTAIAGLETNAINTTDKINCAGVYPYAHKPVCWYYSTYRRGHGALNVSQSIQHSCNCFYYEVGNRIGIDTLANYSKYFGLGRKTGIELPSESSGSIAGKDKAEKENREWYLGETLSASIGQSYNNVTPLQMAKYISILVNGGHQIDVTIVKSIINSDKSEVSKEEINEHVNNVLGVKDENIEEKLFEDENVKAVLEGMKNVTTESGGTAYSTFKDSAIQVGGKTGSAQAGDKTHAWFVGFAPYDDPEIAVVTIIENGAHGAYAAQVARDIFDSYFFEDEVMEE